MTSSSKKSISEDEHNEPSTQKLIKKFNGEAICVPGLSHQDRKTKSQKGQGIQQPQMHSPNHWNHHESKCAQVSPSKSIAVKLTSRSATASASPTTLHGSGSSRIPVKSKQILATKIDHELFDSGSGVSSSIVTSNCSGASSSQMLPTKDAVIRKMKKITQAIQELFRTTKESEFTL